METQNEAMTIGTDVVRSTCDLTFETFPRLLLFSHVATWIQLREATQEATGLALARPTPPT